jgi:hypothetical protein
MKKLNLLALALLSAISSFAQTWQNDYSAGSLDQTGNYLGGNEIMHIVAHKGKIYAGNSYWKETDTTNPRSCEIMVKASPASPWRLDKDFTEANQRVNALKSIVFTTDSIGNPITPDTILLAIPTNNQGQLRVYTRNDALNSWYDNLLISIQAEINCRAIGNYIDPLTGVHKVFIGLKGIGVLAGTYNPRRAGKIKWDRAPEFNDPLIGRFMGFAICNGKLFCAADKDTLRVNNVGQIYERTNGTTPTWQRVYRSTDLGGGAENTRGLTAIPTASGIGEELIFTWKGNVRRLQPLNNYNQLVEANLLDTLQNLTGYQFGYVLSAYNNFFDFTIPNTQERVHLIGIEATYSPQQRPRPSTYNGSWSIDGRYLIRRQTGNSIRYQVAYIVNNTPTITDTLVAVRNFCLSPFPSDSGRVLYSGGFDCNDIPSTKQAWIYRGQFSAPLNTSKLFNLMSPITLYPNPTTNILHLSFPSKDIVTIQIKNSIGLSVITIPFTPEIAIDHLPAGLYSLIARTANSSYVAQFLVSK